MAAAQCADTVQLWRGKLGVGGAGGSAGGAGKLLGQLRYRLISQDCVVKADNFKMLDPIFQQLSNYEESSTAAQVVHEHSTTAATDSILPSPHGSVTSL